MPTENSVITREHLPGLLLARTIWENGGPSLYFPPALQDATDQARAALPAPASVPDGYMPIPTAEQLADALDGVRCFHDMGAELIAPELLANLLAALSAQQSAHVSVPRELLEDLVAHVEGSTCTHDNTHRGGSIWEICDDCGDSWADDRGGKPAFKWPDCVEKARALLNGGEA